MKYWNGLRRWSAFAVAICAVTEIPAQSGGGPGTGFPPPPELRGLPGFQVEVADAETRVLIATVHLRVGDLTLSGAGDDPALSGTYEIEVPIRSSKDESGSMVLPLERPVSDYFTDGGVITGKGLSFERPGETRRIVCQVRPDADDRRRGELEISVDTGSRVLEFVTEYRLVGDLLEVGFEDVGA